VRGTPANVTQCIDCTSLTIPAASVVAGRHDIIYTGMGAALVEPGRARVGPASFGGISVRNGVMLLSDFIRRQIIRLRPL
jgi:hypothetical protein